MPMMGLSFDFEKHFCFLKNSWEVSVSTLSQKRLEEKRIKSNAKELKFNSNSRA